MEHIIIIFFYLVTLLYSIILHEISHGVVALWLGDRTAKAAGRLTLDPIPHIDPIGSIILPLVMVLSTGFAFGWAKPVPYNPNNLSIKKWGDVIVAWAGPITNFLIALIAAIVGLIITIDNSLKVDIFQAMFSVDWERLVGLVAGDMGAIGFAICAMLIFWNVLLGVFNLIPIPPLDGSKIVFALVNVKHSTRMFLEQWGFVIVLALIMIPMFNAPFRLVLSVFWGIFYAIAVGG